MRPCERERERGGEKGRKEGATYWSSDFCTFSSSVQPDSNLTGEGGGARKESAAV